MLLIKTHVIMIVNRLNTETRISTENNHRLEGHYDDIIYPINGVNGSVPIADKY